jgi:tuftelin-interacting protein 11
LSVSHRYQFWKGSFSEAILDLPGVAAGFTRGLQLMYKATELPPEERAQLPKPDTTFNVADLPSSISSIAEKSRVQPPRAVVEEEEEVSFRSLVEEFVAERNLLFVPMGKVHEKSRQPLFRVSQNIDGRGGVTVYISDEAVWAAPQGGSEEDAFRPIGLEEMVLRASRQK